MGHPDVCPEGCLQEQGKTVGDTLAYRDRGRVNRAAGRLHKPVMIEEGHLVNGHHRATAAAATGQPFLPIRRAHGVLAAQREWHAHVLACALRGEKAVGSQNSHDAISSIHLACPSGIAGNLFATACTLLGVPGSMLHELPERLGLPPAFQARFDGRAWDGYWDPGADPGIVGGPVAAMPQAALMALGDTRVGNLAATILTNRWDHDPMREAFGEVWCDTLFDAAAAAVCLDYLGRPPVTVHGALPQGCEHPVAARILSEWSWEPSAIRLELVTPTGAAILKSVATQSARSGLPEAAPCQEVPGRLSTTHQLPPLMVVGER